MRHCPDTKQVNYAVFRSWLASHYPSMTSDVWEEIISEDEEICYSVVGCGLVDEEVIYEEPGLEDGGYVTTLSGGP